MKHQLGKKFWITLVIFSLMGQVAWVVENMYFNVFIYKMFHASASDISLMVAASAGAATITTWLVGALSDKIGKRKIIICGGYILWGFSILAFAFIRMDILSPITGSTVAAASLGVTLVIIMDCVMTFFGSSANDAAFNAWLTDMGDDSNRGKIEGINAMMPLIGILVVFGGFMAFDLERSESWVQIYTIIGVAVIVIGVLGLFLIKDAVVVSDGNNKYWENVIYSFRPSVIRSNKLLYAVVGAFAIFGISIQIFMPYLILYYEKTLGMENYVIIMAPAIVIAAVITSFYGKLYDMIGFQKSVIPTVLILMAGYVFLFFFKSTIPVFVGSLLMMTGYLTGMAIFGAMIRDHMPEDKVGMFQGLRIFGQVFIPGNIGPAIGAAVLVNAEMVVNGDGTTSFLPNQKIYLAAFIAAVVLLLILLLIFKMIRNEHHTLTAEYGASGYKEYPRPQLRRASFYSLNGKWLMNGQEITVPYPLQSALSGYKGKVPVKMHYERHFNIGRNDTGNNEEKLLLHFGAVDQNVEVYLNGSKVGEHQGGYLPFTIDITKTINVDRENVLEVYATDKLSYVYPYGKQTKKRGGMWYTPVSGIWQSIWMEWVPDKYIEDVKITPKEKSLCFSIQTQSHECKIAIFEPQIVGDAGINYNVNCIYEKKHVTRQEIVVDMEDIYVDNNSKQEIALWTEDSPYLYPIKITTDTDEIETYAALRAVSIDVVNGMKRICLNHKPIFLNGVLDQGYYCDGIFIPGDEEEYTRDILRMKELGFNVLRKHIKVEPEKFYYECDRLGMMVMQDMVNSGRYSFIRDTALPTLGFMKLPDQHKWFSRKQKDFFIKHSVDTIQYLYNHPCIVGYTIFNEGWGQFESDHLYEIIKNEDKTRFIDSTSGWFAQEKSDVESLHIYFRNEVVQSKCRPVIISECGGYSYAIENHYYSAFDTFGYGTFENSEALTNEIIKMYEEMVLPSIPHGLCGCIYTQLSDVEDEINGLYTYDRKVCKVNKERIQQMNQKMNVIRR